MTLRAWEILGPDELHLTVKWVAKFFDYEEKTWRQLIREGWVMRPRGFGQKEYYTGKDVAILLETMGRWGPGDGVLPSPDEPPQTARKSLKPPETA